MQTDEFSLSSASTQVLQGMRSKPRLAGASTKPQLRVRGHVQDGIDPVPRAFLPHDVGGNPDMKGMLKVFLVGLNTFFSSQPLACGWATQGWAKGSSVQFPLRGRPVSTLLAALGDLAHHSGCFV